MNQLVCKNIDSIMCLTDTDTKTQSLTKSWCLSHEPDEPWRHMDVSEPPQE